MNNKKTHENTGPIIFCTECGSALTDFYKTGEAKDEKKVKEHYENCRKTGKFKGEMCSRMFIALEFELPEEED